MRPYGGGGATLNLCEAVVVRLSEVDAGREILPGAGRCLGKSRVHPRAESFTADANTALNAAQTELKILKGDAFKQKVSAALNKAQTDGKLTPAARAKWEPSITDDTALNHFTAVMDVSPVLTKDQIPAGEAPAGGTALNAAEIELGKHFGNSEEDLKKYGK